MSIGAGATTGGAVNAALVEEDFDRAVATSATTTTTTAKDAAHV
jgi:hypothetical protein